MRKEQSIGVLVSYFHLDSGLWLNNCMLFYSHSLAYENMK